MWNVIDPESKRILAQFDCLFEAEEDSVELSMMYQKKLAIVSNVETIFNERYKK